MGTDNCLDSNRASINHQPVTTLRGDKVLTHRGDLRVLGHGQGLFSVLNLNSSDDAVRDAWSEDSLEAVLNHLPSANVSSLTRAYLLSSSL